MAAQGADGRVASVHLATLPTLKLAAAFLDAWDVLEVLPSQRRLASAESTNTYYDEARSRAPAPPSRTTRSEGADPVRCARRGSLSAAASSASDAASARGSVRCRRARAGAETPEGVTAAADHALLLLASRPRARVVASRSTSAGGQSDAGRRAGLLTIRANVGVDGLIRAAAPKIIELDGRLWPVATDLKSMARALKLHGPSH